MDLNFDLDLVQAQKLVLTPQMKQAIDILRMNSDELFRYAEEQMESNPVLEVNVSDMWDCDAVSSLMIENNEKDELEEDGDDCEEITPDLEPDSLSLKEYLLLQLHISVTDRQQVSIGEYLIDSIDENGYLTADICETAAHYNLPVEKVKKTLTVLQSFDPPGVGARNLRECLLIQLKHTAGAGREIREIVNNHLNELACNNISDIADKTSISCEKIEEIAGLIKKLDPKPGREFYGRTELKYQTADVIVKRLKNRYDVLVNEDAFPDIGISQYYRRMLSDETNGHTASFIRDSISCAVWLIKCIEQRKTILVRIVEYLVKKQADFFEKGRDFIVPSEPEDIAEELGMHKSILEEILRGKYLQSCFGIFELKGFFMQPTLNNLPEKL